MKKILKFIFTATLILTMVFSGTISAFGSSANSTSEVKVQLNGENIIFTNNAVKNVNGSNMVPLRQILTALGADLTYDSATKTVSAKTADTEIVFTVGTTEVTVVKNGTKSIKTMGTAPFIDGATQSTYVPVRFFAESLGYCVGWDAQEKTVILIDPSALFGNADEDFSIIANLIKTDLDYEQAYETKGKFDMKVAAYKNAETALSGIDVSVKGDISGIQQRSNADLVMSFTVDADEMTESIPAEDAAGMALILDMLKNITMDIKMDGETGTTYLHSGIYSLVDPEITEDTWFKMDIYKPYEESGINMKALTRMGYSDMELSELLALAISSLDDMDTSTYKSIKAGYVFLKNLVGDEAFQTKTTGSINTHTLKIDKDAVFSAMVKTALSGEIPDGVLELGDAENLEDLEDLDDLASFGANIIIKEKGGTLYNYDLDGSFATEGIDCSFNIGGDEKNADVRMVLDMKDVMKIDVRTESHLAETSKAPDLNPPSGATILEYAPETPAYTLNKPEALNAI